MSFAVVLCLISVNVYGRLKKITEKGLAAGFHFSAGQLSYLKHIGLLNIRGLRGSPLVFQPDIIFCNARDKSVILVFFFFFFFFFF